MCKFAMGLLMRNPEFAAGLARSGRRSAAACCAIGRRLAFYRSSFFVVIPSFNHQERKWIGTIVVLSINTRSFIQCFPAGSLNVTVESPFRGRIVEARPCASDGDLVGVLVPHGVVTLL